MNAFDFVICGAGTSGCILANRLSADPSNSVLLLEAGGEMRGPNQSALGAAIDQWDTHLDWAYRSTPQVNLNNRRILLNRGKGLGGSSGINFGMYVRGNRGDYDQWMQLGNRGWSYDEVLPYFRRSERSSLYEDEYHGAEGNIQIELPKNRSPLQEMCFEALEDLGVPRNPDYNGAEQVGSFLYQFTLKDGKRVSAADGFLTEAVRARENLTILTGAHVTGVTLEGKRATGVTYARGQNAEQVSAGEVILSLGAIGSPHILMLSGVGPADHLQEHDIKCRHDLSGIGQNLLDHPAAAPPEIVLKEPEPFGFPIPNEAQSQKAFEQTQTGPLASIGVDAGAFVKLSEAEEFPNGQLVCTVSNNHSHRGNAVPTFRIGGYVSRTHSRGSITLASSSPFDSAIVDPKYYSDPLDLNNQIALINFQRDVAEHKAFDSVRAGIQGPGRDRDEMIAAIREDASTCWHLSSSCRMGTDSSAVVDPELRVHGLENLRVADVSVFPTMPSGNTNAPTMMVAEKAADLALGKTRAES